MFPGDELQRNRRTEERNNQRMLSSHLPITTSFQLVHYTIGKCRESYTLSKNLFSNYIALQGQVSFSLHLFRTIPLYSQIPVILSQTTPTIPCLHSMQQVSLDHHPFFCIISTFNSNTTFHLFNLHDHILPIEIIPIPYHSLHWTVDTLIPFMTKLDGR